MQEETEGPSLSSFMTLLVQCSQLASVVSSYYSCPHERSVFPRFFFFPFFIPFLLNLAPDAKYNNLIHHLESLLTSSLKRH